MRTKVLSITMACLYTTFVMASETPSGPFARVKKDATLWQDSVTVVTHESSSKDEENRNVMLNASEANGPREIQIGLPSADVNVLENGLPVTFETYPLTVNTVWRSDASLSHVGLQKISETAITTGNIGYAVTSTTQLGEEGFNGILNYKANHYGQQEFSINLNGSMGQGWYYSANMYQDFDPGTFKLKSTTYQDRTQIYKVALTKRYGSDRGEFTAMYHYSNSHNNYFFATASAPFIYVGDGSVKEYGNFSLGTTSYLPIDNKVAYMDIMTGEMKEITLDDATENRSSQISLMNTYQWDNGLTWKTTARYDHSQGSLLYQTARQIIDLYDEDNVGVYNYVYYDTQGNLQQYDGQYVQTRISAYNVGKIDDLLFTSELEKKFQTSTLRFGVNEWFYYIDYASSTAMYDQTVNDGNGYAYRVWDANQRDSYFYAFNSSGSGYYKGHINKFAFYATHDWDITPQLKVYYGARLEWQQLKGENAASTYADGEYIGRFDNYYIGATLEDGTIVEPSPLDYNWFNYDFTIEATYKLTRNFGFTGDFTYIVQHPMFRSYWPATLPSTVHTSVPLGRGGIYYNNSWLSLTSLFSYISKTNNNTTISLEHGNEILNAPVVYDIQTIGWTTDIVTHPFEGFNLHFLFTYQNPTYRKYETSVTFSDGYVGEINATGNTVEEISKVLVEIDPSYNITKDLRIWTSFRYFSKTYANINEAYYFNGHWETFGGVNWQVNKRLALGCTVINFLNQTGATGSIAGAELITKEEATGISNQLMTGSYLRPFTVEFTASLKF